jgi:hypothetical protein
MLASCDKILALRICGGNNLLVLASLGYREQVPPIVIAIPVNLKQDTLPWCVLKLGKRGAKLYVLP